LSDNDTSHYIGTTFEEGTAEKRIKLQIKGNFLRGSKMQLFGHYRPNVF